jgi:hypothetical protein
VLEQEYLAQPLKKYRLLTEVSLWWTLDMKSTKVEDCSITFKSKRDRAFSLRAQLASDSASTLGFQLPKNYMRVVVNVTSRTPSEAAERSLEALDLLRASWNLTLNRGKTWRYSSTPSPVNDIRLSPFHTVHELSGAVIENSFWYEPSFRKPINPFNDKSKFLRVQNTAKILRQQLRKSPYSDDLRNAMIRYVRALDSADLNDTFLRLWSLLEYLTDSSHDPYKVATRRAAFLFRDKDRSQLVLANLTSFRNRFVHAGVDSEQIESLVFQLKRYVDALLLFHLGNSLSFTSRSEAANFMDLPTNVAALNGKMRRILQAIKFVGG